MKKLFVLFVLVFLMSSCVPKNDDGSIQLDASIDSPVVVVIDSCEYIKWNHALVHKGNCKFCAERNKKVFEDVYQR